MNHSVYFILRPAILKGLKYFLNGLCSVSTRDRCIAIESCTPLYKVCCILNNVCTKCTDFENMTVIIMIPIMCVALTALCKLLISLAWWPCPQSIMYSLLHVDDKEIYTLAKHITLLLPWW